MTRYHTCLYIYKKCVQLRAAILLLVAFCALTARAQQPILEDDSRRDHFASDSVRTEGVPEGIYAWNIERRFGTIRPTEYDTVHHLFQNEALVDGMTGSYNYLGNLGSPRYSRLFTENIQHTWDGQFVFKLPYSYFLREPDQLMFTNTKSPFTNLTYQECGDKQHGEDRLRAIYSINVNKRLGLGFKLDYLYGRGYYDSQATSQFNGTLFGSYVDTDYQMHAMYYANHLKTSENGGLENDTYVTNPEAFPTSYGEADMPMNLSKSYNKLNVNTFYLTHRLRLGRTHYPVPESMRDSTTTAADTVMRQSPMLAVHTLRFDHNNRRFISNASAAVRNAYFQDVYMPSDSASDFTKYIHVDNLLALELQEGANKWLKTGGRLFARHEFYRFTLPEWDDVANRSFGKSYTENYVSVGAAIMRDTGQRLHYHLLGELRSSGHTFGEFNIEADASLSIPFRRDSLRVRLDGFLRREQPNFYLRHYHGRNAWWDNDLSQQISIFAGGEITYKETRLRLSLQSIQNYAYLAERQTPYTNSSNEQRALFGVGVEQKSANLQMAQLTLNQNLRWGILNWENELTFQASSDNDALPLPLFTAWTNLYLKFTIAKVLRTELGADMRYFTRYYAPTYSPVIGQFAVQDAAERIKLGNYPIVNAYANFHLKRTRFYVSATHVNYSSGSGMPFLVPHYPLNRLILRLGLSWNFVN
ncbi:MAG: putative porin [Alloprevotella sp.]|nr:putative porin [Alloprevotella sp.]